VDETISLLDEQNQDSVNTVTDILPALNRASQFAFDILARVYPEPLLRYQTLVLESGINEYDIPEDIFEDRVLKIEASLPQGLGATYTEIKRISYRDISNYETVGNVSIPQYYCIIGRKIRFVGTPDGSYSCRLWAVRNPEKLMLPQGRVTLINSPSNYLIIDETGSSLTTESDKLGSYVNLIDGQTGEIKSTMQIQQLTDNRVTFRTVPTRATVLNRTIEADLDLVEVAQDDYLSPIDGTCVPYFGSPTNNFLIQFAVAEITRKLGGPADTEENILKKFEQQVERTWAGREISLRVKKKSDHWGSQNRHRFIRS
jgi:hypothetical protein